VSKRQERYSQCIRVEEKLNRKKNLDAKIGQQGLLIATAGILNIGQAIKGAIKATSGHVFD